MTYLLYDIKFYKLDENEEPIRDSKGNLKLFEPQGRWKILENLCEDLDDEDFKENSNAKS